MKLLWMLCVVALAGSPPHQETDGSAALGPQRSDEGTAGVSAWSGDSLPQRWSRAVGEGFAGPAVDGETMVLFHRVDDEEVVEALDSQTGETRWRAAYPTTYRDDFGFDEGPRATPTIADGVVYTFGAQGVLQALRLNDGERLWLVDTHEDFGVRKGFFGAATAPLAYGNAIMVNVGGGANGGIVGFDRSNGTVLWTATEDEASYSAPVMAELQGVTSALFFARTGLVEIDPDNGEVRRQFRWRSRMGASVNAASPIVVNDRVFISASYGTGATLLEPSEGTFVPVWASDDIMTNHYATSVYHDGSLFGFHGRQEYSPALRAVDLESGEIGWNVDRYGAGSLILAGDNLLILRERGELVLAAADPAEYRPLASAQVLPGVTRAYPALAANTLFARNERQLVAIELLR